MKTRLLSAAVLLPVLFLVIWVLPTIVAAVLVGMMAAFAAYELLCNAGFLRHMRLTVYCMVAAMAVSLWSYWDAPREWGMLGLLVFIGVLFGEMMHNRVKVRFEKICLCLVAGILLPYLLTALVRILGTYTGRYTIIIPFILAFLPDSGAYFAGTYLGKHKLAPVLSPNKTVEGAVGGAVTAIFGMMLYALIMDVAFDRSVNYWIALLYGILGAGVDIFGDLMFSVIKRQTGIKDYGNLIPGHGGILDRFDSMMMVAPFVEILLIILPVVK
jgi:phosphatidate cytidylyltransferase